MSDAAWTGCVLAAALFSAVTGMSWLSLSMPVHARQVWGMTTSPMTARTLRWMGVAGLCVSLVLCLTADHASMAVLVWVMALAGASLLVAFTLASRPHWLKVLSPWVRVRPDPVK